MRFVVDNQLPPSLSRFLANRRGDCGRLLWVRIGNCRRDALHRAFERALPSIVAAFESGQRIVELA